jgi:hypothetical protein
MLQKLEWFKIELLAQVSIAIRRGYVPDKFQTSKTKTGISGQIFQI